MVRVRNSDPDPVPTIRITSWKHIWSVKTLCSQLLLENFNKHNSLIETMKEIKLHFEIKRVNDDKHT